MKITNRRVILILATVITFLFCIVNLIRILSIRHGNSELDLTPSHNILAYLRSNLKTAPIMAVLPQAAISRAQCPEGFLRSNVGKFYGSSESCYCGGGEYANLYDRCSSDQGNCSNVMPFSTRDLLSWDGIEFCIQRASFHHYTAGDCSPGFRKCGRFLCIQRDQKCPLSHLNIDRKDNEGRITFDLSEGSDDHLVFFDHSLNEKPCLNYLSSPPRTNGFVLPYYQKENGCEVSDSDTVILEKMDELKFYQNNNLHDELKLLPLFKNSTQGQKFALVARMATRFNDRLDFNNKCSRVFHVNPETLSVPYETHQKSTASFGTFVLVFVGLSYVGFLGLASLFIWKVPTRIFSIVLVANLALHLILLSSVVIHQALISKTRAEFHKAREETRSLGEYECYQNQELNIYLRDEMNRLGDSFNDETSKVTGLLILDCVLIFLLVSVVVLFYYWRNRGQIEDPTVQGFIKFDDDQGLEMPGDHIMQARMD